MANFRTIGWFGSECPVKDVLAENMVLYTPDETPPPARGLPLEVAMKIFWEAQTINISGSITTENLESSFSNSINETFEWGAYISASPINTIRSSVATAKEMLCFINSENQLTPAPAFPWHTAFSGSKSGGFTEDGKEWFTTYGVLIYPQPFYNPITKKLCAPISFAIDNGGLISAENGFGLDRRLANGFTTKPFVNATIVSPWGTYSFETVASYSVSSGNLTLTVTAADPEVRYA